MPTQQQTRTIGSHTYHVRQLGAQKASHVFIRITKMLGIAIGDALGGETNVDDVFDVGFKTIGSLVGNLARGLDEKDFDFLCQAFIPCTDVTGGQYGEGVIPLAGAPGVPAGDMQMFDMHFAGRLKELGEWLMFCLEVNYHDFLPEGGIKGLVAKARQASQEARAKRESQSQSPSISGQIGRSGE